ncbi:FecR domain-containing protein [Geobacter sp. SVR]|uniref:FecR family protein n=1 Tax=Geobacter sp. SVR TaxID=2495594 RepID=UPI00143EF637|nr:FecR domain-containing protein [Geobacter sp. SVR]BCS55468.1 hypothetical protein GSVR_37760 [Geobacter sp. SVR]GCF83471.1 hypothetical protein GSbR_00710 [Geobacter sp. SVR]
MRFFLRTLLVTCLLVLPLMSVPLPGFACHAASIATLRGVTGAVDIMRGGALPAVPAKEGDQVSSGDLVRTKSNAFAEVVYHDGTVLKVAPRTRIDIGEHFSGSNQSGSEVKLARGKVQAIVDLSKAPGAAGAKKFEIRTPNAIAGVRGTDFIVSHQQGVTGILVRAGSVYSFNPRLPNQVVTLASGMVTTILGNAAPSRPRPAHGNEVQRMEQGMTRPAGGGQQSDTGESNSSGTSAAGGNPVTEGKYSPISVLPHFDPLPLKPPELKPAYLPPPPPPPQSTNINVNVNVKF